MSLNAKRHIKFITRHLGLLPPTVQKQDANKLALLFYSLVSLSALDVNVAKEYGSYIPWVWSHYHEYELDDGTTIGGFVGSHMTYIADSSKISISLSNTLFALLSLLLMGDTEAPLKRQRISQFVSRCQLDIGGFVSVLDYESGRPSAVDSCDLRFTYIAVSILYILGCRNAGEFGHYVDLGRILQFIDDKKCASGGFGDFGETHGGYTSCALSSLQLLKRLDMLEDKFTEDTLYWLTMRQISRDGCMSLQEELNPMYDLNDDGGFQGRENKFADTCYAFWCLNSINILASQLNDKLYNWVTLSKVEEYLLQRAQNQIIGGFSKNDEDEPDLYHTCLGISVLKLMEGKFHGALCIPKSVSDKHNL